MNKSAPQHLLLIGAALALLSLGMCGAQDADAAKIKSGAINEITSTEQFTAIIDAAGSNLLGFDLYADWCAPCRTLLPRLEKIAQDNKSRVTFYRINVDKQPELARAFKVSGIPLVAFVKNKTVVAGLQGLQPESEYITTINQFTTEVGAVPRADTGKVMQHDSRLGEKASPASGQPRFENIGSQEFRKRMGVGEPLVLDVRTPAEYSSGHLPGAKLIPVGELAERIAEIARYKDREVLVYCRSGNRSLTASQILRKQGFLNVYNLKGGINDWRKNGFGVNIPQSPNAL